LCRGPWNGACCPLQKGRASGVQRQPPVIRISVERIQLDAVATDKKGRHVTDLRPEEIEIFQDGERLPISEFSYVRSGVPAEAPDGAHPSAPPAGHEGAPAVGLYAAQATLQYLSDETGGLALVDDNDMGRSLARIVDDLSGYYLIGYTPRAGTFDSSRFHRFDLKVKRAGLKVRTREGFYPVTDDQVAAALR
jgi:hypothetical protein